MVDLAAAGLRARRRIALDQTVTFPCLLSLGDASMRRRLYSPGRRGSSNLVLTGSRSGRLPIPRLFSPSHLLHGALTSISVMTDEQSDVSEQIDEEEAQRICLFPSKKRKKILSAV